MLAVFYTFHYGVSLLYLRGLPFAMLMMSIVAGAGLMTLRKLDVPWLDGFKQSRPLVIKITGILLTLVFIVVTLTIAIPERQTTPYYYMIDQTDYEAFTWVRDNIGPEHNKAILDPWKATAFSAISQKYVYTRIHMAPTAVDERTYEFIRSGSSNTTFLRENGISIIYTRLSVSGRTTEYPSDNPDLTKVADNIYILK